MSQTEEVKPKQLQASKWIRTWGPIVLFAIAAYFPIFLHLGSFPLKNFDESLFAMRAYKMAHEGEYLYN
ncbi:MAG: hypothetical protein KDE26_14675, partial [Bacteroidetes bacterium]|nr:hypothetical protein [Bacteroidota bacterium]